MYDPWVTRASKLASEREIYRRYEIACQLREVKAEHRRRRQRQLRSWVSSLWRCVFSPLAAYWRWSGREDRKPETMQFLGDRLERGTPPPAAPPDTVAAVSVSRRVRQYGDQDSGGWH
jgi:hypothetical protein